jgi:hypothetical protein
MPASVSQAEVREFSTSYSVEHKYFLLFVSSQSLRLEKLVFLWYIIFTLIQWKGLHFLWIFILLNIPTSMSQRAVRKSWRTKID